MENFQLPWWMWGPPAAFLLVTAALGLCGVFAALVTLVRETVLRLGRQPD